MATTSCNCGQANCTNLACGCADTSQTTPCQYNDCRATGAESCEDIQCAACVSYCGDSFSMQIGSNTFRITNGERLDKILQRVALWLNDPSCITNSPQLVYIVSVTNNSIKLGWSGVPASSSISVEYKLPGSSGWSTAVTGLGSSTTEHTITNLTSNSTYELRLKNGTCYSVTVTGNTLI